ncbi:MAG: DUF4190 domain-containing protein [Actinobacteria bacterium]|nr:DUF4190 domain-containing protein [Actinomycetota bacterium]
MVLGIAGFAFCLALIGPILALVFGYKARRQIDESNGMQTGRGMATAGIVLGWVWIGLFVAYILLIIAVSIADSSS